MAKYVNALDIADPALVITADHCASADVFVDAALWERQIDPAAVALPNSLLTEIATHWAKHLAAEEGALGEDSPLYKKSKSFKQNAELLTNSLNRKALGLDDYMAFGNITIGRG